MNMKSALQNYTLGFAAHNDRLPIHDNVKNRPFIILIGYAF